MPARIIRALVLILVAGFANAPDILANTEGPEPNGETLRFADVEIGPDDPTAGSVATVRFSIEDQDGNAVSGLRTSGLLREPSTAQDASPPDPTLTTIGHELSDPGQYEVTVALNQPGRWWIEVHVENGSGDVARYDHFTVVSTVEETAPATRADPIFLRGDEWDAFYRVDPDTGSVVTLDGTNLFQVGSRWWITDEHIQERGSISTNYGGTWHVRVDLKDAISGNELTSIDLGHIRANVFSGSQGDPAIATSTTVAPDGSAIYIYWARQLGEGWVASLVEADPLTGDIRNERLINGAVSSNGFWAEIYLRDDGHILVAEQIVELASVSGYRLSLIERGSLEVVGQYRRTDAREDPLTHCMLAYPGPVGAVAGTAGKRFSVCSPPAEENEWALMVWDPATGAPQHSVDLLELLESDPAYLDGIASPDNSTFFAIDSRTLRIAEVDLESGTVIRERNLMPEEDEDDPSTLDRFFDWVFGSSMDGEPAPTPSDDEPRIAISPDGSTLYVAAHPENREPEVLVIDTENLELINSLKAGETVDGIASTNDGRLLVIQRENNTDGDTVTVLDRDGNTYAAFTLPGRSDLLGAHQ